MRRLLPAYGLWLALILLGGTCAVLWYYHVQGVDVSAILDDLRDADNGTP